MGLQQHAGKRAELSCYLDGEIWDGLETLRSRGGEGMTELSMEDKNYQGGWIFKFHLL